MTEFGHNGAYGYSVGRDRYELSSHFFNFQVLRDWPFVAYGTESSDFEMTDENERVNRARLRVFDSVTRFFGRT